MLKRKVTSCVVNDVQNILKSFWTYKHEGMMHESVNEAEDGLLQINFRVKATDVIQFKVYNSSIGR